MPFMKCQKDKKSGVRWGHSGTCYTGPNAKKKAAKQAQAAYSSGYKKK